MKYNDNHPQKVDAAKWQQVKPSGQYRFAPDVTGAMSWQCRFEGATVYGLASKNAALAKIRELRDQKMLSDFFLFDFVKI